MVVAHIRPLDVVALLAVHTLLEGQPGTQRRVEWQHTQPVAGVGGELGRLVSDSDIVDQGSHTVAVVEEESGIVGVEIHTAVAGSHIAVAEMHTAVAAAGEESEPEGQGREWRRQREQGQQQEKMRPRQPPLQPGES